MMKFILLYCLFWTVNGLFRLYNTDVLYRNDLRDCLYSFRVSNEINEWELVPYCIRDDFENNSINELTCYGNVKLTFKELKLQNISSYNLYEWNAPIDTISNYEIYLINNNFSMNNDLYCNCSNRSFGINCEYSFDQFSEEMPFDEIILNQYEKKDSLKDIYEIVNDSYLLTCYEGIKCNSTICLDWRQICDGFIDCQNGEDEFNDCLLIETNECNSNEYRCGNGMCISKIFLIDLSYDCGDVTDELYTYPENDLLFDDCYKSPVIVCDFYQCRNPNYFSCGDGQCELLDESPGCHNGRDLFFRRNRFVLSLSGMNNESVPCWFLLLCISEEFNLNFFGYDSSQCECTKDNRENDYCFEYFQEYCPSLFYFQTEINHFYPFVEFVFDERWINSSEWWEPTHLCYKNRSCSTFLFDDNLLINDFICIERELIPEWSYITYYWLKSIFSFCNIPDKLSLIKDGRLFYCNTSNQFISKHRVQDSIIDCYFGEDEDSGITSNIMYSLNSTNRFKCTKNEKWMVRPLILEYDRKSRGKDDQDIGSIFNRNYCEDGSHKFYVGNCKRSSDLACQFMRGDYSPVVYNIFRENCNKNNKFYISIDNETDETNCEEWSTDRCDNVWDWKNGEDELNCSNTIYSYITQTVLKCNNNEHYCAYQNATMGCLSKERAGDGIIDCLGALDERMVRNRECYVSPDAIFKCSHHRCLIPPSMICDGQSDCNDNDDELMCRSLFNSTCNKHDFVCKNGTCILKKQRCNKIIDCQPNGEDEWFCDLYGKEKQFSLNNMEEYPLMNIDLSPPTTIMTFNSTRILSTKKILSKSINPLDDWYCNRGVIVKNRFSNITCLCPPSYYGLRCQYQSERVLITVRIDTPISLSRYQNKENAIRLIARLMYEDVVTHHEQILHISLMKQIFYLNYPRPPPRKRGNWSVRFDGYLITRFNVDFKASWLFPVLFAFLPVNRLVLYLMMNDPEICNTINCIHGSCRKYLNPPHDEYCQCEENWSGKFCNVSRICSCIGGGRCIDRYSAPICVCPIGRIGIECGVIFNPCTDIKCRNGGTCLPLDERQLTIFICLCPNGYYGSLCEQINSQIDIHFSESLFIYNPLLLATVFIHFMELKDDLPGILFVQNRLLYKQIRLNTPLVVFNKDHDYLSSFILLQIYFQPHIFHYYIGAVLKKNITKIKTIIDKQNRCPYVDELILNETVRRFPIRKKVKYYHYVCEINNAIKCFYDEASLCFCDKYRQPDCLIFQRESTKCIKDYCKNNGRCVQNNYNGIWDFGCVCSGCTYGSLCQLMTSEYVLSLDVILGQDIREDMSITEQSILIKIVLIVIILMLLIGTLSNILSLMTFKQPKIQEYGCGIYLFCLPLIGQTGLVMLIARYFYLLRTQSYHVDNHSAVYWSCIGLEYFLNICPMLFDWLIVCVAVERSVNLIKGASFKKSDSVWWAKRIILLLTFIILCSSWHELFIREVIQDPRATSQHTWCVITFPWKWLKYYRLIVNLINLIVPGLINLVATIFLLHKSARRKQMLAKKKDEKIYWIIFKKQLPMYGSPFGLVILSLVRLIFSFTLVCITHQWQKYVYLTAYFITFAPLMGTFPIFVLPAKIYKTEFNNLIARFIRKLRARRN